MAAYFQETHIIIYRVSEGIQIMEVDLPGVLFTLSGLTMESKLFLFHELRTDIHNQI